MVLSLCPRGACGAEWIEWTAHYRANPAALPARRLKPAANRANG
ncbi:MAG: hypothetical protein OJF61_001066 [Rhodanobacteraceae bacterium]|jgi:hypothetical protein|nr:MAG: hypothetical protein OJF61_001066 [Rhodanobacteraceae bacterium]